MVLTIKMIPWYMGLAFYFPVASNACLMAGASVVVLTMGQQAKEQSFRSSSVSSCRDFHNAAIPALDCLAPILLLVRISLLCLNHYREIFYCMTPKPFPNPLTGPSIHPLSV